MFDSQLQSFTKTFLLNGYPSTFIDTCIRRFLDKIFSPPLKVSLAPKKIVCFCLPYTDDTSSKFTLGFGSYAPMLFLTLTCALFSVLLSGCLTFLSLRTGFLRLWGLYSFKCQRCSSLYGGQTSRLHTRIKEHLGISALTGKKRVNPPTSTLSRHCDTGHPVSPDDFTILSSSSFNSELLVRESFLIF